jgi:hypothetical protein
MRIGKIFRTIWHEMEKYYVLKICWYGICPTGHRGSQENTDSSLNTILL